MAIPQQQQQQQQQVGHDFELSSLQPGSVEQNPSLLLDALYCEEDRWEDEVEEEGEDLLHVGSFEYGQGRNIGTTKKDSGSLSLPLLLEQDLFWEDEELISLFAKEQEQVLADNKVSNVETDSSLSVARQEAVGWMLKVIAYYGFSTLTAILSINYLDRFLSSSGFQKDKPWMIQLVAVTCLSLAAKVEETEVPLLLDLQVEETKYIFEAKTIQRMELLVLSTLKWRMHPVTTLSFLDHIVRRLGLKTHTHWEFRKRCERLVLSVVHDSRSVRHLPSVLATATMMHVIDQVELFNPIDYQDQLLGVLKISKEKVKDCYGLILELLSTESLHETNACRTTSQKRKCQHDETTIPSSPSGVIDASVFSCDSSNDSWGLGSSVSSSPAAAAEPHFKKSRTKDPWVFVDTAGSSPR